MFTRNLGAGGQGRTLRLQVNHLSKVINNKKMWARHGPEMEMEPLRPLPGGPGLHGLHSSGCGVGLGAGEVCQHRHPYCPTTGTPLPQGPANMPPNCEWAPDQDLFKSQVNEGLGAGRAKGPSHYPHPLGRGHLPLGCGLQLSPVARGSPSPQDTPALLPGTIRPDRAR